MFDRTLDDAELLALAQQTGLIDATQIDGRNEIMQKIEIEVTIARGKDLFDSPR